MNKIEEIRNYCLNCINKPCSKTGCPLGNDIPEFIHEEDTRKAFEILCKTTVLPAICGRICPHSKQCQGSCIRGIKGESVEIGKLESYIGDISLKENYKIPKVRQWDRDVVSRKGNQEVDLKLKKEESTNNMTNSQFHYPSLREPKIAVIGSGPCGLTCAAFLARYGAKVTIYEKYDKLGGLLRHGIPDFRLDREIVEQTINKILDLGIEVETGKELGKNLFIKDLQKKYDAVFVSIGANISNETLKGKNIIKGNEFLEQLNVMQETRNGDGFNFSKKELRKEKHIEAFSSFGNYEGKKVAISGGGNVAMDCARTFIRLGANVTIIYRRDEEQMPAEKEEIEIAKKEGVKLITKTNIKSFDSENKKLKCIKTKLVKKEDDRRLSPVDIEGSDFELDFDYVVLATGAQAEKDILQKENLELNEWGYIKTNEKYQTSIENVYAGGDVTGTKATVAYAAKSGRDAAFIILGDLC